MSSLGSVLGGLGGGQIGRASVDLVLNTSKYQAQLAETEASTAQASASMTAAFGLVGAGVAVFAATSIKAAIEQKEAQDKLANSIANSAKVSFDSLAAFNAQADSLSKLTGVQDDNITSAQAMGVQFGLTADQVTTLTPLVLDLAAKNGIDLTTAMSAVGKAVNGNSGALARLKLFVDKAAFATDHYGATVKALGAVQGFAAQKADAEPWVKLTAQFHEMQEAVGKGLLPPLVELTGVLADLFNKKLPDLAGVVKTVDVAFGAVTGNIALMGQGSQKTATDTADLQTEINAVNASLKTHQITAAQAVTQVRALGEAHGMTETSVNALSSAEERAAAEMSRATHETMKNTAALKANRQQVLADAGGLVGLSASLAQLADDEAKVNEARRKGTIDTKAGRDAERTYLQDKIAFIQALNDEKAAMLKSHDSTQQIVNTLTRLGTAAGITRKEIEKLIAGINGLPSNKTVRVNVVQTGHVGRVNMPTGP